MLFWIVLQLITSNALFTSFIQTKHEKKNEYKAVSLC